MAVTFPNAGKKTDMRKFASFEGKSTLFSVSQSAAPEIYTLAQNFPDAVWNALFMLGGHTRKRMQRAVREGGTTAHKWLGLSDMRAHRRSSVQFGKSAEQAHWGKKERLSLGSRWKQKGKDDTPFGRAGRALAFRAPKGKLMVEIGALSPTAANFIAAVQEGRWGDKGKFQLTGRQRVTPRVRRAMWAAGFPLGADTTVIGHEGRPLVPPVFQEIRPEMEQYLVRKVTEYLHGKGMDWVQK